MLHFNDEGTVINAQALEALCGNREFINAKAVLPWLDKAMQARDRKAVEAPHEEMEEVRPEGNVQKAAEPPHPEPEQRRDERAEGADPNAEILQDEASPLLRTKK